MAGINRIDPTPARISTNLTVGKQTQGSSFGERVHTGLQQAGSAIASGAALVGGALPGGAIISAAVSSVTQMSGMPGGAASSASYAAAGISGTGTITTLGAGGSGGGSVSVGGTTSGGSPNLLGGAQANNTGGMTNSVAEMSAENMKMMQVQIAMQRENQVFSSVSNVLKTKHDTVKNSIGNIR